ncbi:MAG: sfuC [Anaerosporomusa subterranea]|jgi:iron(III) transport system ATP-binding protein|nr:sfuC [Anaerosporomusa subterranea]
MSISKSVSIKNIEKVFEGTGGKPVRAVDNVSIDIQPGEFMTLLGPSGCGKTTILRMIAGFETPTKGDILIGEDRVNSLTPDKRDTAMVFQSYALFPHLNVFENIAYGLKIKKLPTQEIKSKVCGILEIVGLTGYENRAPNQLSGGQQQRIALARSLVMEPAVLLFDEPLSNLDAKLRVHMRAEIRNIQRRFGITSIYVTHDQAEAMSMSDRIIIMNHGLVEQVGTPHEIYKKPASRFVADFIGLANILDGEVMAVSGSHATIKCLDALLSLPTELTLEAGQKVHLVARPEALSIAGSGQIPAKVESSVFMGAYQDYKIRVQDKSLLVIDSNPALGSVYPVGADVYLRLDERSLHIVQR